VIRNGILTISLCLILASWVLAAGGVERNDQPIQIKSNELFTDSAAGTATFSGKVVARQGDLTIYSDRLVVHYTEKEKDVDRVEAFGNVRIVQGNRRAEAGHATYESRGAKITLDGNSPKVFQGEDVVTGNVITYFVDEQRSVVVGGKDGRVQATIHPKGKGSDAGAKP
jgi:lipopolysaccharide export system protein LptA